MKAKLEFVIPKQTTPKAPTAPITNRSITPAGWIPPKKVDNNLVMGEERLKISKNPSTPYTHSASYDAAQAYAKALGGSQPIMNLEQAVKPTDQGGGGTGNTNTGSGSGVANNTQDQLDYEYLTGRDKAQYQNSLSKYDLQVRQAMADTDANNRSAYISMMQQNRVAGAQQQSQGVAGSGYSNTIGKRIDQNFSNSKEAAKTNYNRTIDDINQAIADAAFTTNQSLSDRFRTYKDAKVTKQTVTAKKYTKR